MKLAVSQADPEAGDPPPELRGFAKAENPQRVRSRCVSPSGPRAAATRDEHPDDQQHRK